MLCRAGQAKIVTAERIFKVAGTRRVPSSQAKIVKAEPCLCLFYKSKGGALSPPT